MIFSGLLCHFFNSIVPDLKMAMSPQVLPPPRQSPGQVPPSIHVPVEWQAIPHFSRLKVQSVD